MSTLDRVPEPSAADVKAATNTLRLGLVEESADLAIPFLVGVRESCLMNRADTMSPPVSCLILDSAQRRPSSVSAALTRRAPRSPARSVGWRSPLVAVNVSIGAVL